MVKKLGSAQKKGAQKKRAQKKGAQKYMVGRWDTGKEGTGWTWPRGTGVAKGRNTLGCDAVGPCSHGGVARERRGVGSVDVCLAWYGMVGMV